MLASGMLLVALLSCLTIMVLMSVWRQRKFWGKLPPGPRALPFIGNYLQLNTEQMYNSLMKISQYYGPVFTVHLGTRRIVVLCGHEAVKEALVDQAEEFSGRGQQATFDWLFKGYGEGDAGGGMWSSRLDGLSVPAFFSLRESPSSVSSVQFCLSLCPL
ncbi:Cytochrome P450 2A6 [Myotis davidii]|uniref:Cytochrome P450 2A6 n=1 Tax=Myotis davidii TaxID=225400 RepID=L5M5L3_MYODS|nr:Cytochrome P450 2A6 [Myotis davidii]